jgi:hypothetical protein
LLGRVRPAIKAATRGIRGFRAVRLGGKEANDLSPIVSSLDEMGPVREGTLLRGESVETEASACRATSPGWP